VCNSFAVTIQSDMTYDSFIWDTRNEAVKSSFQDLAMMNRYSRHRQFDTYPRLSGSSCRNRSFWPSQSSGSPPWRFSLQGVKRSRAARLQRDRRYQQYGSKVSPDCVSWMGLMAMASFLRPPTETALAHCSSIICMEALSARNGSDPPHSQALLLGVQLVAHCTAAST